MEISPVTVDQIVAGADGRQYAVTGQAGEIAKRIVEIDPSLRVEFQEAGMFFVIIQTFYDRKKMVERDDLVMRVPMADWNENVVREIARMNHNLRHGVSQAAELDAFDDAVKAESYYQLEQEVSERAYPLFRAFQRGILGINPRAFIAPRKSGASWAAAA